MFFFIFLKRSIPFSPKEQIVLKTKDQKLIKVEAPFIEEISRLVIIKVLDKNMQNTVMLKVKITQNLAILDVTHSNLETVIFVGNIRFKANTLLQNKARCAITTFE